jgi:hypothetical protein
MDAVAAAVLRATIATQREALGTGGGDVGRDR